MYIDYMSGNPHSASVCSYSLTMDCIKYPISDMKVETIKQTKERNNYLSDFL